MKALQAVLAIVSTLFISLSLPTVRKLWKEAFSGKQWKLIKEFPLGSAVNKRLENTKADRTETMQSIRSIPVLHSDEQNALNASLLQALTSGNLDSIKIWVEKGADVNCKDENGQTPLIMACEQKHILLVEFLLARGSQANCCRNDGVSALQIACFRDEPEIVKLLVQNGAGVNYSTNLTFSPLNYVVTLGKLEMVKLMVELGADVNHQDKKDYFPLQMASAFNHLEIAKFLLEKGGCANIEDRQERTPLITACTQKNISMVKLLLEHGAYVNWSLNSGRFALHTACYTEEPEIVKLLVRNGANPHYSGNNTLSPLNCIAGQGKLEMVKLLVQLGADVNHDDRTGHFPLGEACRYGQLEVAKFLIEKGAKINHSTKGCRSALDLASYFGHLALAKLLISKGAKVNLLSKDGMVVFQGAVTSAELEMARFLLEKGADPHQTTRNGTNVETIISELSPEKQEVFIALLQNYGISRKTIKEMLKRKLIAHLLGFRGRSFVGKKKMRLEGLFPSRAKKELKTLMNKFLASSTHPLLTTAPEMREFLSQVFVCSVENEGKSNEELSQKIQSSEPILFSSGWHRHATSVFFYKNFVVKCNRGYGSEGLPSMRVYESQGKNLEACIAKIKTIGSLKKTKEKIHYFNREIDRELGLKLVHKIKFKKQKVGNCGWMSYKTGVFAAAYVKLRTLGKSHVESEKQARAFYREFTAFGQVHKTEKYLAKLSPEFTEKKFLRKITRALDRKRKKAVRDQRDPEPFIKLKAAVATRLGSGM